MWDLMEIESFPAAVGTSETCFLFLRKIMYGSRHTLKLKMPDAELVNLKSLVGKIGLILVFELNLRTLQDSVQIQSYQI